MKALRVAAAWLALILLGRLASAQELSISASVNKNVVSLQDQIALSVTVSGPSASLPEPQLPSLPNFTVYSSGRSQNLSIVNGQVSSSIAYTYILTPRFHGKVTIAPISITAQGKKVETAPIDIQVVRDPGAAGAHRGSPGPASPAPGTAGKDVQPLPAAPDIAITASVDKKKVYVNEQVTLSVRFYAAVPLLGNPQYVPPSIHGFLSEDLPPERHQRASLHGRVYSVSEIRTALFPTRPGRLVISPAMVRCQVQSDMNADPFAPDFFQRFFSQGVFSGQTRELKTDSIVLQVEPLPEQGKPDSFSGAVGRLRATAEADKRQAQVGEAVTLSITISGSGNLKTVAPPPLPAIASLRAYDTLSSLAIRKEGDVVQGSKTFKTVLVPRASGRLSIPSVPFSYFDPARQSYVRAGTQTIELEISPASATSPAASFVASSAAAPELSAIGEDIRYIHESQRRNTVSAGLVAFGRLNTLHILPFSAFLLSLGLHLYRKKINADPAGARLRAALSNAQRSIRRAEKRRADGEPGPACALLWDALEDFLSDTLNQPVSAMTLRQTMELLQARFPRVPQDAWSDLKTLWEELDLLRFAGANAATPPRVAQLATITSTLLKKIDREMRA
ncbi:MAG: protein BatD [Elusimicrobia bacterium]|nr:protein BatD [Elusimicrobiota bacterium]